LIEIEEESSENTTITMPYALYLKRLKKILEIGNIEL